MLIKVTQSSGDKINVKMNMCSLLSGLTFVNFVISPIITCVQTHYWCLLFKILLQNVELAFVIWYSFKSKVNPLYLD